MDKSMLVLTLELADWITRDLYNHLVMDRIQFLMGYVPAKGLVQFFFRCNKSTWFQWKHSQLKKQAHSFRYRELYGAQTPPFTLWLSALVSNAIFLGLEWADMVHLLPLSKAGSFCRCNLVQGLPRLICKQVSKEWSSIKEGGADQIHCAYVLGDTIWVKSQHFL